MKVREMFASDAAALAHRGLIDGKPLADLKGGPGYLNVAYDLGALVRMLRERWSEIASKSAIQASELAEAEKLYEQISRAYGARMRESVEITRADPPSPTVDRRRP